MDTNSEQSESCLDPFICLHLFSKSKVFINKAKILGLP